MGSRLDNLFTSQGRGEAMEQFKQFILKHFEKITAIVILISAFIGTYFIREKTLILNFYYLPVVFSAYFLGRRLGVLTAVLAILSVINCAVLFPLNFFPQQDLLQRFLIFTSWGGFLILTSFSMGTLYERKERQMQELKHAYIGILEILSKYIESTDRYTKGHSVRVSELATETAIAMELPRGIVENVRVAGLLHDLGKIEISGEILRKAASLTPEEKELIDTHPAKGAYILTKVGEILKEVVPIVISHHRYFIETLKASEEDIKKIPLGARIIAVVDAFDAMTTDRPYRKGKSAWEALQEIDSQAGKQFDPQVVESFKRVIEEKLEKI